MTQKARPRRTGAVGGPESKQRADIRPLFSLCKSIATLLNNVMSVLALTGDRT